MEKNELEIELLTSGETRVSRLNGPRNNELLELMKEIGVSNLKELELFLEGSNHIQYLLGEEPLCG